MKRLLIIAIALLITAPIFAQDQEEKQPYRRYSIGLEFFNDIWMDLPDNVDPSWLNRGVSVLFTYNIKTKINKVHFSPGLGITSRNLYAGALPESTSAGTTFINYADSLDYDKAKTNINYLDIPLELRYDPGDWHFALGFRFSYKLSAHTKYKGQNPEDTSEEIDIKKYNIEFLQPWMLGASARIGYRWVHLSAYYSLSKLFKSDLGPQMYPISVGITFMPFKYH